MNLICAHLLCHLLCLVYFCRFVSNEPCFLQLVSLGGLEVIPLVFIIPEVILNTEILISHRMLFLPLLSLILGGNYLGFLQADGYDHCYS